MPSNGRVPEQELPKKSSGGNILVYRPGKIKNQYCEEVSESVTAPKIFFFNVIVKKLKLYKIYKKKNSYINKKHTHIHANT